MAKSIVIEVLDPVYELTSVGAQTLIDFNNVPNRLFNSSLSGANQGLAGCDLTVSTPLKQNWIAAGGAPISTNWKPWAYDSSATPGAGFCQIIYRDTPLPTVSAGKLVVGGSSNNTTEYVRNWDFTEVKNAANNYGFVENNQIFTPTPLSTAITANDAIGPPLSNAQAWYGAYTRCTAGFGNQSPTTAIAPIQSLGNAMGLLNGWADNCFGGGVFSQCCIYQEIQGLTPGTTYRLSFELSQTDGSGLTYLQLGWDGGPLVSPSGDTYIPLGGSSSALYGSTGAGSMWGGAAIPNALGGFAQITDGHFNTVDHSQTQSFVAQGGNEVLAITYWTWNDPALSGTYGGGDRLWFDSISIQEANQPLVNFSGIYGIATCFDSNASATPSVAHIKIDVSDINASATSTGDAITICSYPAASLVGSAVGLQRLTTTQLTLSNNPTLPNVNHPLSNGLNTITVPVNTTSSIAPFSAADRIFDVAFLNFSGNDIKINSIDVEYHSTTVPTDYQTIDPDKSIVGKLEVSNSEDFPLNLTYNISDGKELENRFGDYSQTFDLPATANNNKLLNYIWNASVGQKDKVTWGIKKCTVNVDGVPFFEGSMQIKKSSHDSEAKSYSCTLYGGNFSWMSLLKDKELCEVFDAGDTFPYNYADILNRWPYVLATSNPVLTATSTAPERSVQFPIISYRDFNIGGLSNTINVFDENKPPDFQPAFYVYNIFKKIFANIGYTISSNFIETEHVRKLINPFPFLSNDAKDDAIHFSVEARIPTGTSNFQSVQSHVGLGSLTSSWTTVKLSQDVTDPSLAYDNATGIFTCQKAGNYDVSGQCGFIIQLTSDAMGAAGYGCGTYVSGTCDWQYTSVDPDDSWTWATRIRVETAASGVQYVGSGSAGVGQTTGSPLDWWLVSCWDCSSQYTIVPPGTVLLDVGDTIRMQGKFVGSSTGGCEPRVNTRFGYDTASAGLGNTQPMMSIKYTDAVPVIGSDVEKNNILPCGVSQVDYIKSISQLFNLYFTTDVQNKTVYIEPFNEFFESVSNSVDWSTKVDFSKEIEDNYDVGLKRELRVGYKIDGGDKYAKVQNDKSNIYGETNRLFDYNETLGEDFEPGMTRIESNLFASSTQVWDNDAHDDTSASNSKAPILIPNLWTEDCYAGLGLGNSQYRPPDIIEPFVPRIYYYHFEAVTIGSIGASSFSGAAVNPGGTSTYWTRQHSTGSTDSQWYPRATFVDWEESKHSETMRPSLSFSDEIFTAPGKTGENNVPGLYTYYYKNMIEQLKQAPRIRTVYINLKISDILNLDMRKLIQIDGAIWRINRIVGYSPANNQSTKVELIQWIEVGFWPVYRDDVQIIYK